MMKQNLTETQTYFDATFPMVKLFAFDDDSILVYDAKPHFMFLLKESELPILRTYLETRDRELCCRKHPGNEVESLVDGFEKLCLRGVFVPGPADSLGDSGPEAVGRKLDYYWENILMRKFVLEITERCNFRCKYCFNTLEPLFRHHTSRQMSLDTAKKSIDFYMGLYLSFFRKLLPEKKQVLLENYAPCLGIYGGEPTLNWSVVVDSVEYYKSRKWSESGIPADKLEVTINTNLSRIDVEIMDFLLKHNVLLFVSLDGPKSENDRNRVDVNGRGTFDMIYANLMKIKAYDAGYFKNKVCVLAVQADNCDRIANREFLESLGCQISYLPQSVYGCFIRDPEEQVAHVKESAEDWIVEKIAKIEGLKDQDRDSCLAEMEQLYFLDGLLTDAPRSITPINVFLSCPMGIDNILIGANGDLHICHKTDGSMPFGNVHTGVDRKKMIDLYSRYMDKTNCKECRSCWALHFCGCCAALRMKQAEFVNPEAAECDFFRLEAELNFRLFIEMYKRDPGLINELLSRKKDLKYYKSIVDFNEFNII